MGLLRLTGNLGSLEAVGTRTKFSTPGIAPINFLVGLRSVAISNLHSSPDTQCTKL